MAAKLKFAAACLGLVAFASGAFLGTSPKKLGTDPELEGSAMNNLQSAEIAEKYVGMQEKDLEEMENTVELLLTGAKKDDPATQVAVKHMAKFIENTLIANRERAQKLDQEKLDLKLQALHACHLDQVRKTDTNTHGTIDVAMDHKDDYNEHLAKHGDCVGILESKALLKNAYCSTMDDAEKICSCDERLVNTIHTTKCHGDSKILDEHKTCCDAYVEKKLHEVKCQEHMANKEFARKQHKIIMTKVCKQYDQCFDSRLQALTATEKSVRQAEQMRSWKTVSRLQCLIKAWKAGEVSKQEAQACKEHDVPEGIQYPKDVPVKATCNPDVAAVNVFFWESRPGQSIEGKPILASEIEADPNHM